MPSEHGYNGRPSRSAAARSTRRKKKVRLKKRAYVVFALLIILICSICTARDLTGVLQIRIALTFL